MEMSKETDSGATSHICNQKVMFTQLNQLESPVEVKLGDGRMLEATAIGTVKLRIIYGQKRSLSRRCCLTDVLYVPELSGL